MQETLRTVKYSAADDVKFEKIAMKLGRSKRQVFSQMLDYFYRSKKESIATLRRHIRYFKGYI